MQKENCFSAWSCDVKTWSVTETANNLSIRTQDGKTAGLVDVGTRYALWVNADQSVAVLDLKTGYHLAAGFSVHVLATDSLTVVFGDTFDSIFDFINDKRIDVTFTEARIVFADGESETRSITGNTPYVFALNGVRAVKDVEFISDDLAVKYSDFFSEDLMEASETLDTADLFN